MTTFTIDSDNNISAHAGSPASADESQSFRNQKELAMLTADWPASRLVDTWNSFAGVAPFDDLKPIKKFTNREIAVERIYKAVQRLAANVAQQAAHVAPASEKAKKAPSGNPSTPIGEAWEARSSVRNWDNESTSPDHPKTAVDKSA
jgi:hypothetical protein